MNTLVEQDHRFIKGLVKPGLGFFSLQTAGRTLQGDEVMHMMRKGQGRRVGKGDITRQISFIASLFGVAAKLSKKGSFSSPSSQSFCNRAVIRRERNSHAR